MEKNKKEKINFLKKNIEKLNQKIDELNNKQMAIKIFINSIYGAYASPYFIAYNVNLAESITLQGQNIIKFVANKINEYFKDIWPNDKELHEYLGIKNIPQIKKQPVIYGDTDSVYTTFEDIVNNINYENKIELINKIYTFRLKNYIIKNLEEYSKKFNTKNILDFEFETLSYSAILLAKKKYILDIAWETPDIFYNPQEKIKYKGIEIIQSSTPLFARKYLNNIIKFILNKKNSLNEKELIDYLKQIKKEFLISDIENISFLSSIGDYNKFILNDKNEFVVNKHCPIHVRGAGYYNYLLNNSKEKIKKKYSKIKTGDKIKFYYTKDNNEYIFSFLPGYFPVEFAPPVNYDLMFEKEILEPINRIIEVFNINKLNSELLYTMKLF